MPEHTGPSVDAIRARQSQLARRHGDAADADRVLAEALASAQAATTESLRRLDVIADEIELAVRNQVDLAVDTPLGAREMHRFLLDKQREITAVMADAREVARAKRVVVEGLRAQYSRRPSDQGA
jgi:hypothetical protein